MYQIFSIGGGGRVMGVTMLNAVLCIRLEFNSREEYASSVRQQSFQKNPALHDLRGMASADRLARHSHAGGAGRGRLGRCWPQQHGQQDGSTTQDGEDKACSLGMYERAQGAVSLPPVSLPSIILPER